MPTLTPLTPAHHADVVRIWNAASHPDYPITRHFLAYNTTCCTGEAIQGRMVTLNGQPVGFVLASAVIDNPASTLGWVSAIAVHPSAQRQGLGSELLAWAESWLKEKGCQRIRLGGNLRPFLPGLPVPSSPTLLPKGEGSLSPSPSGGGARGEGFFNKRGFQSPANQPYEYDIARSLKDYQSLYPKPAQAELLPMKPGQEPALLEFLVREYPGRWEFEAREFVKNGGRPSDFLLLWVNGTVQGFCRTTLPDSERPIERFYPQRLGQPWGQFGPLGLSKAVRGQGLGGYLIDAAAVHLQSLGVDGCVIDWTALVELYGKFGFTVYNQYISLFKPT
jgi:GNAT superfamily N-acetyltransferase